MAIPKEITCHRLFWEFFSRDSQKNVGQGRILRNCRGKPLAARLEKSTLEAGKEKIHKGKGALKIFCERCLLNSQNMAETSYSLGMKQKAMKQAGIK